MAPKSSTQEKSSRVALRKKWGRRLGFVFLALLTLEFVVYFGANLFFAGLVRERLQGSSNGVYEIEFNRLHLSLVRRGFFWMESYLRHSIRKKRDQIRSCLNLHWMNSPLQGSGIIFLSRNFPFEKLPLTIPTSACFSRFPWVQSQ